MLQGVVNLSMGTTRQHEQKQFDWSDNAHLMPSQLLHPSLTVHTCSTKSTAQTAANLRGYAKCVPLTLMKQSALYVVHEDHEDHGGSWRALKIDKQNLYTQNVFQEINSKSISNLESSARYRSGLLVADLDVLPGSGSSSFMYAGLRRDPELMY